MRWQQILMAKLTEILSTFICKFSNYLKPLFMWKKAVKKQQIQDWRVWAKICWASFLWRISPWNLRIVIKWLTLECRIWSKLLENSTPWKTSVWTFPCNPIENKTKIVRRCAKITDAPFKKMNDDWSALAFLEKLSISVGLCEKLSESVVFTICDSLNNFICLKDLSLHFNMYLTSIFSIYL